jgi:hypothetical protein
LACSPSACGRGWSRSGSASPRWRNRAIAIPDDGSFEGNIAHFLRLESGATYCDACLAFVLRLDVLEVERAAVAIAGDHDSFERGTGDCDQCDRFGLVTCAV